MKRFYLLVSVLIALSTVFGSLPASARHSHNYRYQSNVSNFSVMDSSGMTTSATPAGSIPTANSQNSIISGLFQGSSSGNNIASMVLLGADIAAGGSTTAPAPAPNPNPAPNPAPGTAYAALGDSVAAGLGLPAADSDTRCGRSTQAYPRLIAQSLNLPLLHLACSGATAGDLFTSQGVAGPNIPPQLDGAFAGGKPRLITITAGANDMQWLAFLQKCATNTCGTATDTFVASGLRGVLATKLSIMFSSLSFRSGGVPPAVVITGYPNPVSQACTTQQTAITANEIAWLTMELSALNQTISNAAAASGYAVFAPVDFSGHDLCSAAPWFQNLNEAAPLHPNAQGQAAMASAVLQHISQ